MTTAYESKFVLELTENTEWPSKWVPNAILEVLEEGESLSAIVYEPIGVYTYQVTALLLLNDKDPNYWLPKVISNVLEEDEKLLGVHVVEVPEAEVATRHNVLRSIAISNGVTITS
jgi:hypothetical protein